MPRQAPHRAQGRRSAGGRPRRGTPAAGSAQERPQGPWRTPRVRRPRAARPRPAAPACTCCRSPPPRPVTASRISASATSASACRQACRGRPWPVGNNSSGAAFWLSGMSVVPMRTRRWRPQVIGTPQAARTASSIAIATATVLLSHAADAGVRFTLQGRSAVHSDNWPVTRGHISVFGDGPGYGDGRVSIGLADITSGRNLVGPGATNACYSPLPGFPVQNGCLHAKALGVRVDGTRLCLALQPGSNLQNLLFSQIVCAPSLASDLGGMGPRITGVLPPTFIEGDADLMMAVAKRGNSFRSAPCNVILMRTAGGPPVRSSTGTGTASARHGRQPGPSSRRPPAAGRPASPRWARPTGW